MTSTPPMTTIVDCCVKVMFSVGNAYDCITPSIFNIRPRNLSQVYLVKLTPCYPNIEVIPLQGAKQSTLKLLIVVWGWFSPQDAHMMAQLLWFLRLGHEIWDKCIRRYWHFAIVPQIWSENFGIPSRWIFFSLIPLCWKCTSSQTLLATLVVQNRGVLLHHASLIAELDSSNKQQRWRRWHRRWRRRVRSH